MIQKVIPLPFLGKHLSAWVYRTSGWLQQNPRKGGLFVFATGAFWIWYETNITRQGKLVSPNVKNHLEYDVKRVKAEDVDVEALRNQRVPSGMRDMEEVLSKIEDPQKREEMRKIYLEERAKNGNVEGTAMVVKSGQLLVREPHWQIRTNEINWMIMSRDQQQQKDHFWYRSERSRDDDYARNTYSK